MADIISSLATQVGVDVDTIKKALGAILGVFQQGLPADAFGEIQKAIPDGENLLRSFSDTPASEGGGLMGAIAGVAGKVMGGQAGSAMDALSGMSRAGLNAGQATSFLTQLMHYLQTNVSPEVVQQLTALLPEPIQSKLNL